MPSFPAPEGRRSKRVMTRASLVVNVDRNLKRLPVSSSTARKRVSGCAEVSTLGVDNWSKLSSIQNRSIPCAVV